MDLKHIKYLEADPELAGTLEKEAYLVPGSIINLDLDIILAVVESLGVRRTTYNNYRMNLNL